MWNLLSSVNWTKIHPFARRLVTVLSLNYCRSNEPEFFASTTLCRKADENGITITGEQIHHFHFSIESNMKPLSKGMKLQIKYTEENSFNVIRLFLMNLKHFYF